ncbi:nucleotidyltransferase domain-containing protein [Alicyclobacillus fodiniaquatilis]|uniref:Nucleotidyltransferase domain-containing protein n=1 Tax=Alicyclobacillus fodiniaquatilis TaxID=1661150 RepID=A0ABW4JIC1_9BACL
MSPLASNTRGDWIRIASSMVEDIAQTEPVLAAFLFGSVAWNDADAASDLDLMILVDREPPFREVTRIAIDKNLDSRVRVRPEFADVDKVSKIWFFEQVRAGAWVERLVHCVILRDRDGTLAALRDDAAANFGESNYRFQRFSKLESLTAEYLAESAAAYRDGDEPRAALANRMALETAALALIGAAGERFSSTHFIETVGKVLRGLGETETDSTFVAALTTASVDMVTVPAPFDEWMSRKVLPRPIFDGITGYYTLAEALKTEMMRPTRSQRLSATDQAWAAFTYATSTYHEMADKVDKMLAAERVEALQFYLQSQILGPARINFGKLYALDMFGSVRRLTPLEFFAGIRSDTALSEAWVKGIGLNTLHGKEIPALARHFLQLGQVVLGEPINLERDRSERNGASYFGDDT